MSTTETVIESGRTSQVRIHLTTRVPDIELPEDTGPILVSTELRRYQLSTLVNRLLSTEKPTPFEFLINGQFLRTSLDDFLTQNGISAETTLSVEYIRALVPPPHVASFQHDDWVSSVDVLSQTSPAGSLPNSTLSDAQERILSGSYDGLIRTWDASGRLIATSPSASEGGHTGPVKAVRFLSPTTAVSSGLDRTLRIWSYTDSGIGSKASFTPTMELYGHTASIDALAVHAPSSRILSASADHNISLWSSSPSSSPSAPESLLPPPSTKRRKLSSSRSNASIPQKGPLATLSAHTQQVSSVSFKPDDSSVAYSTSWDHTLRTWDLTTSRIVDTRTTSHSLLSCLPLQEIGLVAAGTSARHISLIDPRASAQEVVACTLRGHGNAVVSLDKHPSNSFVFASGSHDGSVRVWDVRNARAGQGTVGQGRVGEAVFVIDREGVKDGRRPVGGEGVKVFDVRWDEKWGIVAGGEDKKVQVNREGG